WVRSDPGRKLLPLVYLPALLLGGARVAILLRPERHGELITSVSLIERVELVLLAVGFLSGLAILIRALRVARSVTARRQLRWIVWGTTLGAVPCALGYAIPFGLGLPVSHTVEITSAVLLVLLPLAFASALVRYRLMDVEVIIKRGLVYAAAVAAIAAM